MSLPNAQQKLRRLLNHGQKEGHPPFGIRAKSRESVHLSTLTWRCESLEKTRLSSGPYEADSSAHGVILRFNRPQYLSPTAPDKNLSSGLSFSHPATMCFMNCGLHTCFSLSSTDAMKSLCFKSSIMG